MGVTLTVRSSWTGATSATCEFAFDHARVVLGRSGGADVTLPHPSVSHTHATLRAEGAGYVLVDEGSTNGTRVNDKTVPAGRPKALRAGDRIEIGGFAIEVVFGPVVPRTEGTGALVRQLLRDALAPDAVDPPRLRVLNGERAGEVFVLPPSPSSVVVGRGEECDLRLPDADCSREHAEFRRSPAGVRVIDLESKNGILVDDEPVAECLLDDRVEIVLGQTRLAFEDPAASKLAEIVAAPVEERRDLPRPADVEPAPEPAPEADAEAPSEEPAPADVDPALEETPLAPAAPVPTRAKARSRGGVDLVVYVLAGAVLALSLAGLAYLLSR